MYRIKEFQFSLCICTLLLVSCENTRKPTDPRIERSPGYHIYVVDRAKSYISEVLRYDTQTKTIDTVSVPSLHQGGYSLEVSPYDDVLYLGNNSVLVSYDLRTRTSIETKLIPAASLAISSNGKMLAAWGSTKLQLLSGKTLEVIRSLDRSLVVDPRFSDDCRYLTYQTRSAVQSESLYVARLDVESGIETRHFKGTLHHQIIHDPSNRLWYRYRSRNSDLGYVFVDDGGENNLLTVEVSPSYGYLEKSSISSILNYSCPGLINSLLPGREELYSIDIESFLNDSISMKSIQSECYSVPGLAPSYLELSPNDSLMVISEVYSNRFITFDVATQEVRDTVLFQVCQNPAMDLSGATIALKYATR